MLGGNAVVKQVIFFILLVFKGIPFGYALELELTQGINAALPIGINSFVGGEEANRVAQVIKHDLHLSGQFNIIPVSYASTDRALPINLWRQAGADSVLSGEIFPLGHQQYQAHFELVDAAAHGKLLWSKRYQIREEELRALAHHVSDEVYHTLTGERGVFSTRIAYILVQRNGEKRRYSLEVADMDGFHPQSLLISSEPIMSPSWSPDGTKIAYVSFEKKRSQIYTVDVATGQRRLITDFPGINGAPAWSPDGQSMVVVLSKTGVPKLYQIRLNNGAMTQLTFGKAIDTEPRFSPDGQHILFTSGRGGAPQIYQLALASGQISRVTYEGNYNAKASYTPNQKQRVMLHREDKHFHIGVQDVQSGRITALTSSPLDESPSISPNGRLVLYATQQQGRGVLGIVGIDGGVRMRLPSREGDVQEPAWSPYFG